MSELKNSFFENEKTYTFKFKIKDRERADKEFLKFLYNGKAQDLLGIQGIEIGFGDQLSEIKKLLEPLKNAFYEGKI